MEGQVDEKSGRPLIEGRNCPIDGGIFRRRNCTGIVVDRKKYFENQEWFTRLLDPLMKTEADLLSIVTTLANMHFPINPNVDKRYLSDELVTTGQVNLASLHNNAFPDAQALFAAMLLEIRLKQENKNRSIVKKIAGRDIRNVSIVKDPVDGHAVCYYQGKDNDVHKFDPTKGDTKFSS